MVRNNRERVGVGHEHPTRRNLIEETSRRIMNDGFEGVNVDEVLATVGVTKGSLYHHFTSVSDLLTAGLIHSFESAIRESEKWSLALRDNCLSAHEARDMLRAIVETSQVAEREPMRSVRLHALSLARTQPELAHEIARLQAGLTDTITEVNEEFQRRGWTRSDLDPRALAVLIQAMNLGRIVDDVVGKGDRVDAAKWIALYKIVLDNTFVIED